MTCLNVVVGDVRPTQPRHIALPHTIDPTPPTTPISLPHHTRHVVFGHTGHFTPRTAPTHIGITRICYTGPVHFAHAVGTPHTPHTPVINSFW